MTTLRSCKLPPYQLQGHHLQNATKYRTLDILTICKFSANFQYIDNI